MKYVVVDTETGGLDPTKHPLIEVGYVLETGESYAVSLAFNEGDCDPIALEINGWGKRDFAIWVGALTACEQLANHFAGRLVISSPSYFDMGFLEAFWHKSCDKRPPWSHRRVVDLKSYAMGILGPNSEGWGWGNSEIAFELEVLDTSDHTALADALYTRDLFEALLKKAGHL